MKEVHVGVKFEVAFLPEEVIEDPRVEELIRAGRELAARGYCPKNSGNLSFRRTGGFVITPVCASLGHLTPEDFVSVRGVDFGMKKVFCAGKMKPSSESMMHQMIYDARPEVQAVLHAHTLDLKNAVTTKKAYPYGTLEFARSAVEVLKDHDLVILKDHGFVAVGRTVAEAFAKIS